jgi:hypothetical protein
MGLAMDNRTNKINNKINKLRLDMVATERAMRKDVAENLDCAAPATRLMALRADLARLGGGTEDAGRPDPDRPAGPSKASLRQGLNGSSPGCGRLLLRLAIRSRSSPCCRRTNVISNTYSMRARRYTWIKRRDSRVFDRWPDRPGDDVLFRAADDRREDRADEVIRRELSRCVADNICDRAVPDALTRTPQHSAATHPACHQALGVRERLDETLE